MKVTIKTKKGFFSSEANLNGDRADQKIINDWKSKIYCIDSIEVESEEDRVYLSDKFIGLPSVVKPVKNVIYYGDFAKFIIANL